jgi:hypothetical protein
MLRDDVEVVLSVDDLMSRAEICCPVRTKPGIRQSMILSRQVVVVPQEPAKHAVSIAENSLRLW